MATGMVFAALAFGAATLVEINVVKTVVTPAPAESSLLQVLNVAGNNITVNVGDSDLSWRRIEPLQDPAEYVTLPLGAPSKDVHINISSNGNTSLCIETFNETMAYSLIVFPEGALFSCKLVEDHIEKNGDGNPLLRFLNTLHDVNVTLFVDKSIFVLPAGINMSPNQTVERGVYSSVQICYRTLSNCSNVYLGLLDFGASYTFVVKEEGNASPTRLEDVTANNVHVAWQIPQYVLITAGEVMFSITGLEFSYSQAPANMKSVLQAGWLLTVAFGNVIVLIVAEGAGLEQWKEFLLFAGLLLAVSIIFSVMGLFYTYVDPDELDKVYLQDSKYGSTEEEEKKRQPFDDVPLKKTGAKSTRL